jgi:hypothetical protein
MVRWHEVTWYSKLGAIILFLGVVPVLCFYTGTQYQLTIDTNYSYPSVAQTTPAKPSGLIFHSTPTVACSLTTSSISGTASSTSIDIYVYGPNNGNGTAFDLGNGDWPGPLAFSLKNIPVVSGRWSATISPALQPGFYQINIGRPFDPKNLDADSRGDEACGNGSWDVLNTNPNQ